MDHHPSTEQKPYIGIRRLTRRRHGGRVLEMEDRTRWEVQPGNEVFTTHWAPRARITVVPGSVEDWPFDLINQDCGDRVPARFHEFLGSWSLVDDA